MKRAYKWCTLAWEGWFAVFCMQKHLKIFNITKRNSYQRNAYGSMSSPLKTFLDLKHDAIHKTRTSYELI